MDTNDDKPIDIREVLASVKNDIHEKQQLFIAQKSYADALENQPEPDDTSPEAQAARTNIEQAKTSLENLEKMVNGETTIS